MRFLLAAVALAATTAPASALCPCLKCLTGSYLSFQPVSGSMKPTIEADACVYVDTAVPVSRGDIIAFRHPVKPQETYIFRMIGLPGDTIQLTGGQVILNGTPLPQTPALPYKRMFFLYGDDTPISPCPGLSVEACTFPRFTETLPNGAAYDILDQQPNAPLDTTGLFTVPPDYVFVLGDDRDSANDSRNSTDKGGAGFIPMENILGPVTEISNP